MNIQRRNVVQGASLASVLAAMGLLAPGQVLAQSRNEAAFTAKSLADAVKGLGGTPAESKDVVITAPDIAENGAVVPVGVTSNLPKTQEIYILVEKNLNPLSAGFTIPDGTEPFVQTRVKMAQSTNVVAVVKADGKWYSAVKETKVTLGGCGG
jgi:sulfur-oxidizing protein SoxY